MKKIVILISIILLIISTKLAFAHSGGTDSYGCHTCRTNCSSWGLSTGEYHCHNAKQPYQPKEPVTSHYGEEGTGYTIPEPEYEYPNTNTINKIYDVPETSNQSDDLDGLGEILALGAAGGGYLYWKHKNKK